MYFVISCVDKPGQPGLRQCQCGGLHQGIHHGA